MATLIAEDGVGLYAESHGDGIPVILSNGLCTTCENFRPQVEAFVDAVEFLAHFPILCGLLLA